MHPHRFLDELNAKIQKDHRENSTLPKIIRAQRRDKNDGSDKKPRGKNKKHVGAADERVLKGKERKDGKEGETLEKTKGKQPKTVLLCKQSKTFGGKTGVRGNGATGSESTQEADIWTNAKWPESIECGRALKSGCLKVTEDADAHRPSGDPGTAVARETGESGRSRSHLDTFAQTSEHPGGSWSFHMRPHADGTERQGVASDGAATPSPDRRALTRGPVPHHTHPTTPRELVRDSRPPPPASSPPLLPPPPSTPLTPSFPVTRSSGPPVGDHLGLGPVRY